MIGVAGLMIICGLVLLGRRRVGRPSADDPMAAWLPARDTPLGAIAALERLERAFGEGMPEDQRASLRTDIERLQAMYFGRDTATDAEAEGASLRPQVEQWVTQLA